MAFNREFNRFLNEARLVLQDPAKLSHVNDHNGCIVWNGSCENKATGLYYGIVYLRKPHARVKSKHYTHRLGLQV